VSIYFREGAAAPVPAVSRPAREVRGGSETILVVEDDDALRRAITRVLEQFGYRVLVAADGEDGLNVYRANRAAIELIITDVVMPRLGGPGLFRAVRGDNSCVPFLFSTGYRDQDVQELGQLSGVVELLPKPWTLAEVTRRVRDALDRRIDVA
jgi:DNA-binding response OmpR family regulator